MGFIERFSTVLVAASVASNYDDAIKEWVYQGDVRDRPGFCICTHPIVRNCIVRNKHTGEELIIGNCCIKKFGVEREHFNRSRRNYLVFAWQKAKTPREKEFVKRMGLRLKRYGSLKMTDNQKAYLEAITGKPYRWKYEWEWDNREVRTRPDPPPGPYIKPRQYRPRGYSVDGEPICSLCGLPIGKQDQSHCSC